MRPSPLFTFITGRSYIKHVDVRTVQNIYRSSERSEKFWNVPHLVFSETYFDFLTKSYLAARKYEAILIFNTSHIK